jgi:hypothetical protein
MRFRRILSVYVCLCLTAVTVCLPAMTWGADPVGRPPDEVAAELLQVYGKKLATVAYIPAVAVQSRWRFGELTGDATQRDIVEKLLGEPRAVPKSHSEFAGHLVYATVAHDAQGPLRDRSLMAVRRAADQLFEGPDRTTIRLPGAHEMSDAVFMCGPILCEAGALTGDAHYFDGAVKYLREMRQLRMRDDGLYQHGHLCDAAWGRGNGFPAVGVAWCLSRIPQDHPGREELLTAFGRHMSALAKHQTADGLWRQVVDVPEAYEEFSATAMIGFAMQRGIASGWLDGGIYQPHVDRAWQAVCSRIQPGGKIIDVCEGTGTQKSLEDYLKRKAIRGIDDRGGAMALLFAVERLAAGK